MNRRDIAEMAEIAIARCKSDNGQNEWIVEFAKMVAIAEREACAKVCDSLLTLDDVYGWNGGLQASAKSIRSRGDK
jgi:hypothetical protein